MLFCSLGMAHMEQVYSQESDLISDSQERVRLAGEVFQKYDKEIRVMIRFTVEDQADADDLFQNLFLSLVARPLPSDIRSVKRYLYKAILHDAITRTRREQCHRRHIRVYASRRTHSWEEDPQDVLMRAEQTREIFQRARDLGPTEAKAVISAYGMDCDRQQTSRDMGIKRRSFAKYLWRGLSKLRQTSLVREGRET